MKAPVPFVGSSYDVKTRKADVQRSINLCPTPIESGAKSGMYLESIPGLYQFSGPAPPPPPESCSTLHPISDAWAALTTVRFWECYDGPAFTVRRASDNVETDIYYLADGSLDTASALAFAAGGTLYVRKWFDSSGHGHHFALNRGTPTLVEAGVYMQGVNHGAGADFTSLDQSGTVAAFSVFLNCYLATTLSLNYFYLLGDSAVGAEAGGYMAYTNAGALYESSISNDTSHIKTQDVVMLGQLESNHKIATRWDRTPPNTEANLFHLLIDGVVPTTTFSGSFGAGASTFSPMYWHFGGNGTAADMPMLSRSFLIYEVAKTDAEMVTIQGAW